MHVKLNFTTAKAIYSTLSKTITFKISLGLFDNLKFKYTIILHNIICMQTTNVSHRLRVKPYVLIVKILLYYNNVIRGHDKH